MSFRDNVVLLRADRDATDRAIMRYVPDRRVVRTASGRVYTLPDAYELLPPQAGPDGRDAAFAPMVAKARNAAGWDHEIRMARRGSAVMRHAYWTPDGTRVELLRQSDAGQSHGENERHRIYRNTADEQQVNPTMRGALLKPDGRPQIEVATGIPLWAPDVRHEADGVMVAEGACIPLLYDSFGGEVGPSSDFGGDADTFAIVPGAIQWKRTTYNYQGIPNAHLHEFESHWPEPVAAEPCVSMLLSSMFTCDHWNQQAMLWVDGWTVDLNDAMPDDFRWRDHDRSDYEFSARDTRLAARVGGVSKRATMPSHIGASSNGKDAAIIATNDKLGCVAMLARIWPEGTDTTRPTQLYAGQLRSPVRDINGNRPAPHHDTPIGGHGQRFSVRSISNKGRGAGWRGLRWFQIHGRTASECIETIGRIRALDVMGESFGPPLHILALASAYQ